MQQTAVGGPSELMLRYRGESSYVPWSREQNIFRAAHQFGLRTALVGWYHPYCRVIGTDLDSCTWYSARELSPDLSWKVLSQIPKYTVAAGVVLFGVHWITARRTEVSRFEAEERHRQPDQNGRRKA